MAGPPPADFLAAIVEAAPDGVLAISPDRRILAVNRRFQEMWSLPDDAVRVGGTSPALNQDQRALLVDPEGFDAAIQWGHDHPAEPQVLEIALADGRTFEGYGAGIVDGEGNYHGRVWYLHDATTRRRIESERLALTDRLAAAERSQRFLLAAADALARTTGLSETLRALAEVAVPTLGDLCLIDILEESGAVVRMAAVHAEPRMRTVAERLREWPPDPAGTHPSVIVMRERTSRWSAEMPAEFLAATTRDEAHLEVLDRLEFRSYMAVPLIVAEQVLGAVTFVSAGSHRVFIREDVELAEDLARRMALYVAKERRYDREHEAAHVLQANLLPSEEPALAGLDVAVRYLPGTRDAEIGGDFWDYAGLPRGEAAFAIGDVAGHDMVAAAQMAQIRSVCRALRASGPAHLVNQVHSVWDQLGLDRLATAAFARVDLGTGAVRIATAGHPPPLIVEAERSWFPAVEPAPPFGAPPAPATEITTVLAPGASLVFFTDGLVEHRDRDIDEGSQLLIDVTSGSTGYSAEVLADRILAGMTSEDRSDDVALMVVRRRTPESDRAEPARAATFDPEPSCAGLARRFVADVVREWHLDAIADDAALCTTELATNAILHSRGRFTVGVRRTPTGVRIDVHDDRPDRLPVVVPAMLEPLDTGTTGRGLLLVAGLAERWGYFTTSAAKTVWVEVAGVQSESPTAPIVELAARPSDTLDVVVHLIDVPVHVAIASGVHVDEVIRELQLQPQRLSDADRARLYDLLERSAGLRLTGRQAAFLAAAAGDDRYTVDLRTNADELAAMSEIAAFMTQLAVDSDLDTREVGDDVTVMRQWLADETSSQLAGNPPAPYLSRRVTTRGREHS